MSLKKFLSAIAILALMLFMVIASTHAVRAQPSYPLNSMWVTPESLSTNTAAVGTMFNVTVWAYCDNGTYDWQVTLNYDSSVLNCTNCVYSNNTISSYFTGHTTIPVSPSFTTGQVLFGESLIGSDYGPQNDASLMIATFNITSMPTTLPYTSLLDINATGNSGTFFDDVNGNTLTAAANLYDANFTITAAPTITDVSQVPTTSNVNDSVAVTVSANVTDNSGTGIANATIVYTTDSWATNSTAAMTLNSTTGLYQGTIPGEVGGTTVNYVIDVYDNTGGFAESTPYVTYTVIPEYVALSLLVIMVAMLAVAITIARKKHSK